eukprot:331280_1
MASFVDPGAAKEFECGICLEIFVEPVQIGCDEGHIFCQSCVVGLFTSNRSRTKCPMCRGRCRPSQALQRIPFIERQINNLMVQCPNHRITKQKASYLQKQSKARNQQHLEEPPNNNANHNSKTPRRSKRLKDKAQTVSGQKRRSRDTEEEASRDHKRRKLNDEELCAWSGTLADLKIHEKKCPLQLISCTYCKHKLLRRDVATHVPKCVCVPIQCQHCKLKNILRMELAEHIRNVCPETVINCGLCSRGVKRRKTAWHRKHKCAEALIPCTFHRFGCNVEFKRKDMASHNKLFCHSHLVKVTNSHLVLEKRMDKLEEKMERVLANRLESMVLHNGPDERHSSSSAPSSYNSSMSSSGWSSWSTSSSAPTSASSQ